MEAGQSFVTASGQELQPQFRGLLPVTSCDKHGTELQDLKLSIKYVKEQKYNLISTTKLTENGWKTFYYNFSADNFRTKIHNLYQELLNQNKRFLLWNKKKFLI